MLVEEVGVWRDRVSGEGSATCITSHPRSLLRAAFSLHGTPREREADMLLTVSPFFFFCGWVCCDLVAGRFIDSPNEEEVSSEIKRKKQRDVSQKGVNFRSLHLMFIFCCCFPCPSAFLHSRSLPILGLLSVIVSGALSPLVLSLRLMSLFSSFTIMSSPRRVRVRFLCELRHTRTRTAFRTSAT